MKLVPIVEYIHNHCKIDKCGFRPTKDSSSIVCFGCVHMPKKENYSMMIASSDNAATETLLYVGTKKQKNYTGDGINCKVGDVVSVSPAKKAQLLKDFPGQWLANHEVKSNSVSDMVKKCKSKKALMELADKLGVPKAEVNEEMTNKEIGAAINVFAGE